MPTHASSCSALYASHSASHSARSATEARTPIAPPVPHDDESAAYTRRGAAGAVSVAEAATHARVTTRASMPTTRG